MKKNVSSVKDGAPQNVRGKTGMHSSFANYWPLFLLTLICSRGIAQPNAQGIDPKKEIAQQLVDKVNALTPQIAFTPNMGQYNSQEILYSANAPFGHYTLTPKGLIMGVYDMGSVKDIADYFTKVEDPSTGDAYASTHTQPALKGTGILLQFTGASMANMATTSRDGESGDHFNWLLPGKVITDVHTYSTVTYNNVYKGVDVKYYTFTSGDLENDVIVKPGVDASQVAMEIKGADAVNITADGKLQMVTAQGPVEWQPPVSYLKDATGKLTQIKISYTSKGANKKGHTICQLPHLFVHIIPVE